MGCSNSTPTTTGENTATTTATTSSSNNQQNVNVPKTEYPPSEAYVISFNNDAAVNSNDNEPTVSSTLEPLPQPPKRLQKLMEKSNSIEAEEQTSSKIEVLEDKLNKAELRREAYLQEKIANIKKVSIV